MSTAHFKHVFLIGRAGVKGVSETLEQLYPHLKNLKIAVTVEAETAKLMQTAVNSGPADTLNRETDLIIVVGGDGSLLNAAHIAVDNNLPVLGIRRGRLGFLTDIPPDALELVTEVIQGSYQEESRFFLHAQYLNHDNHSQQALALNDVVLLPGDVVHMQEFSTFIDDQLLYKQRADGLIIATPTGSTAYALSANGPIVQPTIDAIVIVPMHPHTLSSRPIVLSSETTLRIEISTSNEAPPYLSCDGKSKMQVPLGSHITIKRYDKALRLIHPQHYDYFNILREKLNWERHARRI